MIKNSEKLMQFRTVYRFFNEFRRIYFLPELKFLYRTIQRLYFETGISISFMKA
jgi:hypothetical protein